MTATASAIAPSCPKCGNGMWDQKNGKFPWKPGTPIFKCKTKECATNGGVIWEPKTNSAPPVAKSNEKKPVSYGTPGFLEAAESEDAAEFQAKIAPDVLSALETNLAIYQALTEYVVRDIAPIYDKAKIGMSPESAAAAVATLYISANRK